LGVANKDVTSSRKPETKPKGKSAKGASAGEQRAEKLEEEVGGAERKIATHVGRFHKVVRNKHVKGYSSADLAAILGASGVEQVIIIANPTTLHPLWYFALDWEGEGGKSRIWQGEEKRGAGTLLSPTEVVKHQKIYLEIDDNQLFDKRCMYCSLLPDSLRSACLA